MIPALRALVPLVMLLTGLPAWAEQGATPRALREAERGAEEARESARSASRETQAARQREARLSALRAEAGRRAVAAEGAADEARERLETAQGQARAAHAAMSERAAALGPLLPTMLRLSAWPTETLLALPVPPEEALRGALVLRGLARHLREEAAAFRESAAAAESAAARARTEGEALALARARAVAAAEEVEAGLAAARAARAGAATAEEEAAGRAAQAASRAAGLRGALARLEREAQAREKAEREREAAEARELAEARERAEAARQSRAGRLAAARPPAAAPTQAPAGRGPAELPAGRGRADPVAGRVTAAYGEDGARGQTWSAPPGARVVSPCGGRVAFAAPFRSYGLLLIVDCGGGYHIVLSGLDRLDAAVGQRVAAGEAIGSMGGSRAGERSSLYVELRRDGRAVDPRSWLAGGG